MTADGRDGEKRLRPQVQGGIVRRSALMERLGKDDPRRIVSVIAPAGYGKTTLLAQWADASSEDFAWLSLEDADNGPKVLLAGIAEALDAIEPVDKRVFEALASPYSSALGSVLPRLGSALWSMSAPVVLVLDDVHLLRNTEGRAAVAVLADSVPDHSRLVLSGRSEPPVRTARLRAEGRILELGAADLALTLDEASALLRAAGLTLRPGETAELYRRTEGWPAGLYLAALSMNEGGPLAAAAASFDGTGQLVSEYLESALLGRLSRRHREFLTRTSVLERLSGALCEAVLQESGSAADLAELARSNLLLVPLDRSGRWYRYHHLFRDMLRTELQRREPGLVATLQRRAAAWCQDNGQLEEALEYSIAAGDTDTAASLMQVLWLPTVQQGRDATAQRWMDWLEDRQGIHGNPLMATAAAITAITAGRPAQAERLAGLIDSWPHQDAVSPVDPAAEAWAATLRAILCRHGVGQMRRDADEAARRLAAAGIRAPVATLCQAIAHLLSGDLKLADQLFDDTVRSGADGIAPEVLTAALSEQALRAVADNRWEQARNLADQAAAVLGQSGNEDSWVTPLSSAAQARVALHDGDIQAVRQQLASAQRTRRWLTYTIPHIAVQARIELARLHLAMGDVAAAQVLLRETGELLQRRPGLGVLPDQAEALRAQLAEKSNSAAPGASALTGAELRLLPWLSTHLSFTEIAAELVLAPTTIRSQAYSLYKKLGVTSRNLAVSRARELALLG